MILHFHLIAHLAGAGGAFVDERQCVEHPRIRHLQQRVVDDGELIETNEFRVALGGGHSAVLHSVLEALDYLRLNSLPGDIVAVPPTEAEREEVRRDDPS